MAPVTPVRVGSQYGYGSPRMLQFNRLDVFELGRIQTSAVTGGCQMGSLRKDSACSISDRTDNLVGHKLYRLDRSGPARSRSHEY